MKKRGAYTVTFDAWNREVRIQDGTTDVAVQKFNGLNQKVYLKNAAGTEIHFYYNDAWQLLEEQKVSTGAVIHWYVWGTQYIDDLVAEGPTVRYQVNDPRSNVVARIDAAGAVYERVIYEKYGGPKLLSADWSTWQSFTKNQNLFTGRYYNKDAVQNDFRNRFQDPELGVFVTRDPIGVWGDEGNWGNGYGYAGNDPANKRDPSGARQAAECEANHGGFPVGYNTDSPFAPRGLQSGPPEEKDAITDRAQEQCVHNLENLCSNFCGEADDDCKTDGIMASCEGSISDPEFSVLKDRSTPTRYFIWVECVGTCSCTCKEYIHILWPPFGPLPPIAVLAKSSENILVSERTDLCQTCASSGKLERAW
jgi:RHS repeat-associated protein